MSKLSIISTSFFTGGAGKVARGIAEAAAKAGWDVMAAHSSRYATPLPASIKDYKIGTTFGEYIHAAGSYLTDSQGEWSKHATHRLIAGIERFSPDIICLNNLHGHYLNIPLLCEYLSRCNVPVVWTIHDYWPFTGRCAFPDAAGCQQWRKECEHCPSLHNYPRAILSRCREHQHRKQLMFDSIPNLHLVVTSETMAREIAALPHSPAAQIHIINNGIDVGTFCPGDEYVPRSVLAVASKWTPEKGFNDMLRLRELLPSDYPVTMTGVTSRQRKALARCGIVGIEKIESPRELAEYYRRAEVFVTPTHADNFPTVCLESLACGTPVAAYSTGSIDEILGHDCGLTCPIGDVDTLVANIIALQSKGKAAFATACRKKAAEHFSSTLANARYLTLFEQLIKGRQ